jgi:hypothetical protein
VLALEVPGRPAGRTPSRAPRGAARASGWGAGGCRYRPSRARPAAASAASRGGPAARFAGQHPAKREGGFPHPSMPPSGIEPAAGRGSDAAPRLMRSPSPGAVGPVPAGAGRCADTPAAALLNRSKGGERPPGPRAGLRLVCRSWWRRRRRLSDNERPTASPAPDALQRFMGARAPPPDLAWPADAGMAQGHRPSRTQGGRASVADAPCGRTTRPCACYPRTSGRA